MLKIRLSRTGKKSQPSFRVVLQEHTASAKGKFIESFGYYHPATDPKIFKVDLERIKYWFSVGAQPSDAVAVLLKNEGVEGMEKFIAPRDKQKKKKKEEQSQSEAERPPKTENDEGDKKPEQAEESTGKEAKEEPKAEEPAKEETPAEAPKEEPKAEDPKEEEPAEEPKEEPTPETPEESK